ncbi:MAG: hypothetical protein AAF392_02110 [Bacteroidota bacterium]
MRISSQKLKLIKKKLAKPLKSLLLLVLGLIIALMAILQLPYVQNKLFTQLLHQLSSRTQFTIKHQQFQVKWFQEAVLTGFEVKDLHNQEMLTIKQLALQINPVQLLIDRYLTIKSISIDGASINLLKYQAEAAFNITLFLQRLRGHTKPVPASQNRNKPLVVEQESLQAIAWIG